MSVDRDLPHRAAPRMPERQPATLLGDLARAALVLGALVVARLFVQAIWSFT